MTGRHRPDHCIMYGEYSVATLLSDLLLSFAEDDFWHATQIAYDEMFT